MGNALPFFARSSQQPAAGLGTWPRCGMSIANLVVTSAQDIAAVVQQFKDCGVQLTRVNLLSALWAGVDTLPYQRVDGSGSPFDLYDWNPEYRDRLDEVRERMNAAGIVVQWTLYELYSWSRRKPGPQQENTPWRNNINGVYWAPEDTTLGVLPDEWTDAYLQTFARYMGLEVNPLEIGNEFPEKALHERTADLVHSIVPNALVSVNRQENTPGQYTNMMKDGAPYDLLAFHGRQLKNIRPVKNSSGKIIYPQGDLDRIYEDEPDYQTFNQFFAKCSHDPKRIIFSSDGARTSDSPTHTYDWTELREFFQEIRRRGCSIEHQSRAKMTPAPNHHMIEADWFRTVIA